MTHRIGFVLASTRHGSLIVNRFDESHYPDGTGFGVGYQLLETSCYDEQEVDLAVQVLEARRRHHGDGVTAIDGGANIGVHSVVWARVMNGWGQVIAVEAQERLYYALAGNIAINNCFNAKAIHAALAGSSGTMKMPWPDYLSSASFGSLELRKRRNTEFIGQDISYDDAKMVEVRTIALDSFRLKRLDFIKLDVEGMETEVIAGGSGLINLHRPILLVEMVKSRKSDIEPWLEERGYRCFDAGMNALAVHRNDPCLQHFSEAKAA